MKPSEKISITFGAFVLALIIARAVIFNYPVVVILSAVMLIAGFASAIMAAFALQRVDKKGLLIATMIVSAFGIVTGAYHVAIFLLGRIATGVYGG